MRIYGYVVIVMSLKVAVRYSSETGFVEQIWSLKFDQDPMTKG